MNPALPLDNLQHDCNYIFIVFSNCLDGIEIIVGHPHKAGNQRFETSLSLAVTGCGKGCHSPTMKRLFHHDNGRRLDTLLVTVETSQLDCRLIRFATRIAEENFLHPREARQFVGELVLAGNSIEIGGMQHATSLCGNRSNKLGVSVAKRGNSNTGKRIEVFLTLGIGNPATLAMAKRHRQPSIGIHDMRHEATPKNENGGHCRRNSHHTNEPKPEKCVRGSDFR